MNIVMHVQTLMYVVQIIESNTLILVSNSNADNFLISWKICLGSSSAERASGEECVFAAT